MKTISPFSISFAAAILATSVFADSPVPVKSDEKKKAHIVNRTYQMTYGMKDICSYPGVVSNFSKELNRFEKRYSTFLKLVVTSPHYAAAQQRYADIARFDPARNTVNDVSGACNAAAGIMQGMTDAKDGERGIKEMEAMLAN